MKGITIEKVYESIRERVREKPGTEKSIFNHRTNTLSCLPKKNRERKKHEFRVIDTHPIKIKYQNYTRTYTHRFFSQLFLVSYGSHIGVLIIENDDDDEDGKDRVLFIILVKSSFNLISGNKLKNLFQTNFIDNKKNSTRKSGQSSFFPRRIHFLLMLLSLIKRIPAK